MMKYLSVCSGIEAASVAWKPLGWKPFAFSEIDKFASAVLLQHYSDVPNFGDITNYKDWPDASIGIIIGGTPCQSFSMAGLRKGMADPRGNITLTYLAILDRYRPKWFIWENVPGVLSSNQGKDFGTFLGGLAELGYGFAYRVLDAQYVRVDGFGRAVPQRRRRVFVVGYLGDWRYAAAILFERESLCGNIAPCRETGKRIAGTIASRSSGGGGLGTDFDCDGGLVCADVASTLDTKFGDKMGLENQHINAGAPLFVAFAHQQGGSIRLHHSLDGSALTLQKSQGQSVVIAGNLIGRSDDAGPMFGMGVNEDGAMFSLTKADIHAVAYDMRGREGGAQFEGPHDTANIRAASGGSSRSYVAKSWAVRRLTPTECERLQGFPDGYTDVSWRNKLCSPDSLRYKALGNSMAVNCIRWLGRRIELVESFVK